MNILIVAVDFKPETGGVAEYTHQIARYLHSAGDNIVILSRKMNNDKEFDSTCPYIVYRHDFLSLHTKNILRGFIDSCRIIKKLAEKYSADLIISNTLESKAPMCWLVSRLLHISYCIFTYGFEVNIKSGLRTKFRRIILLRGANKVFCISSFTQSLVIKLGVPHNRTSIIRGGIPIKDFKVGRDKSHSPLILKFGLENKKVIFTLARLIERKGIDMVIKALPEILQKVANTVYLIGGDGPYEGKLKELVQKYKVEDHVIFLGRVSESERQAFYDACDIFVMPCRELENGDVEGFGIVFSEANACGKPVIVGKSGGAIDAVKHNETGLLVNPLDINEIADAIIHLLGHPNIAKQMGENGRQRVERELMWERLISKMQSELRKLIRSRYE